MTEVTLKSLAKEIKTSVEILVQKFKEAGFSKIETDLVSEKEKKILLRYLNKNTLNKIKIPQKTFRTIYVPRIRGKNKKTKIKEKQKNIYLKEKIYPEKLELELQKKINNSLNKIEKIPRKNLKISNTNSIKKINLSSNIKKTPKKLEKKLYCSFEKDSKKILKKNKKNGKEIKNIKNKILNDSKNNSEYYYFSKSNYIRNTENNYQKKYRKKIFFKSNFEDDEFIKNKKNISFLQQKFNKPIKNIIREIIIGETISVIELANKMAIKSSKIFKIMMNMGFKEVSNTQILDQETAQILVEEIGHKVILKKENDLEKLIVKNQNDYPIKMKVRSPIVTIMGHVDHGKTTLLDYLRSTNVSNNEVGGITQHIGAYHVKTKKGIITFLDTPGHAAFTKMRARGVQVTDIVILVIAADDGVMPQTIEAIQHAKAAKIPIIVAINKIDKSNFDLEKIKNELTHHGLVSEEWGGDTIFIKISAKTGSGINKLLNSILLQAEILELNSICNGMAKGVVIESFLDKGKGPVATVIVKEGLLKKTDVILCGFEYGRVRLMQDELGNEVLFAGPSIPIKIFGLSGVPKIGNEIIVLKNEKKAKQLSLYRKRKFREKELSKIKKIKIENLFSKVDKNKFSVLNIILKADVQGSVEAISNALLSLSNNIKIKIISSGTGTVTETDTNLAIASNAIIIGFNIRIDISAKRIIEAEKLDFRSYSIIHHLIEDFQKIVNQVSNIESKKIEIGIAEVRNVFKSQKLGTIAGCMILEGYIKRNNLIKILRKEKVIYEGKIDSIRRFKEDVSEVRNGMECGIKIKYFNDIYSGDIIKAFDSKKF